MDPRFRRHGFTDAGNVKEVEETLKRRMGPTQEEADRQQTTEQAASPVSSTSEADRQQTAEQAASPVPSTSGLWSKYDA
ncbi:hypothetical protein ElyMa_001342600 [Elysia marginata]|uniref:Peroxin-14 n=1 Tax=Elysia marginata TaxID=1093978 RepID=A0AAV4IRV8_9GAST|nr:hypothetical protein ElyMa_001342600 [Elysia marginata]